MFIMAQTPVHNYVHNGPNTINTNCTVKAILRVKHTEHEALSRVT